jgi:serine/threonine protein phosphatase 1
MNYLKTFQENKLGRDYVVGDIHGCFSKLREMLKEISFDESCDRMFSVGDLVDRGEESEECLDWLAKPWFHAVRGNHEQMSIDLQTVGEDCYSRHNGMGWILDMPKEHQKLYAEAFKQLPIAIEIIVGNKKYGIIHAEVPVLDWNDIEGVLNGDKAEAYHNVAMWSRDRFNYKEKSFVANVELVYVGHTPLKKVTPLGNVLFIDTGACFKGYLTVLEIY